MNIFNLSDKQDIIKNLILCRENATKNGLYALATAFQNELERFDKVFTLQSKMYLNCSRVEYLLSKTDEKSIAFKDYYLEENAILRQQLEKLS